MSCLQSESVKKKEIVGNMDREKSTLACRPTDANRTAGTHLLETPLGLKRLAGSSDASDFSGFLNESTGTMGRLTSVERLRLMKELLDRMMTKKQGNKKHVCQV